jgi:hypothetical protein
MLVFFLILGIFCMDEFLGFLLVMSEPIFTIFEHFDMEGLVDYLFFMLKT